MTTRRIFLKSSAMAMVGMGAAPAWLSRALYAQDAPSPRKKILVAIFQRGAMDGLNAVVPFGEQRYYDLRPNLALPKPNGTPDSAIDLDGFFGLHPSLAPLKPLWDKGQLACVHAAGSPDPTRSHFDAQDYMESGTPGRKGTSDGWLNRALTPQQIISPVRAVSLGSALPRALRGRNDAVAVNNLNEFQVRDQRSSTSFESMYAGTLDKVLNGTGRETFDAVKLMQSIQKQTYTPANGARYPGGRLGPSLMQIARLIKADVGLEVAFTDMGGWDTHANEVGPKSSQGQLANLLSELGQSMAAFYQDLGDRMADVTVVTMSEFGRTARENGNRGTDHGHANVMFALGGSIKGGKVYGDWPGLEPEQLYEQRDLNLTTDFRDVLGELVTVHLGNREIKNVFPGYTEPKFRGLVTA
ncbi:MAG TPA: DUF1501 domain-containing protein [Bryobacteraceae bacterium]|jgi:uncharacterized protein (DUF1501 family)|nr:DUF1501 domain-containing protein [Bryobacteraceae bacterium]